jgi:hypothetical protein
LAAVWNALPRKARRKTFILGSQTRHKLRFRFKRDEILEEEPRGRRNVVDEQQISRLGLDWLVERRLV